MRPHRLKPFNGIPIVVTGTIIKVLIEATVVHLSFKETYGEVDLLRFFGERLESTRSRVGTLTRSSHSLRIGSVLSRSRLSRCLFLDDSIF